MGDTRWRAGCRALKSLALSLSVPKLRPKSWAGATIELRLGDALAKNVDVSSATHVLLFATCFPGLPLMQLQDKLLRDLANGVRVFCAGDRGIWKGSLVTSLRESSPMSEHRQVRRMSRLSGIIGEDDDDILRRLWRINIEPDATA